MLFGEVANYRPDVEILDDEQPQMWESRQNK